MNQFGQCQALWQKDAVNKIMERFFTSAKTRRCNTAGFCFWVHNEVNKITEGKYERPTSSLSIQSTER